MAAPDVIVVGAGFAGLSAAVRLARRGARVLVVEERRRLGGRASAFVDPETGESSTTASTPCSGAITRRSPSCATSAPKATSGSRSGSISRSSIAAGNGRV
jgi:cation diffusion facilitator CzcD-associated flavoprotein CzcO